MASVVTGNVTGGAGTSQDSLTSVVESDRTAQEPGATEPGKRFIIVEQGLYEKLRLQEQEIKAAWQQERLAAQERENLKMMRDLQDIAKSLAASAQTLSAFEKLQAQKQCEVPTTPTLFTSTLLESASNVNNGPKIMRVTNFKTNELNEIVPIDDLNDQNLEDLHENLDENFKNDNNLDENFEKDNNLIEIKNELERKLQNLKNKNAATIKELQNKIDNNLKTTSKDNASNELNDSIKDLKNTIEKTTTINIRREYKLTSKMKFDLWLDCLRSELKAVDLLDVIDPSAHIENDFSIEAKMKRENLARDIIINRLDDIHHSKVTKYNDPRLIIQKLKEFKKIEMNVTHSSVRTRLYLLKMRQNEKVAVFCEKFDEIIKEYEICDKAIPLTDEEKRSAFFSAVKPVFPELIHLEVTRNNLNVEPMNLEELRKTILQLEAEKNSQVREPAAQAANLPPWQKGPHAKCFRCDQPKHQRGAVCPLAAKGQWYCYQCRRVTYHTADRCFQKGAGGSGQRSVIRGSFHNSRYNPYKFNKNNKNKNNENKQNTNNVGSSRGGIGGGRGGFRGRGTGRGTGRGFTGRGTGKGTGRGTGRENRSNDQNKSTQAYSAGNNFDDLDSYDYLNFIADSGATEHIINKGIILSKFKKSNNEVIRSANKNDSANIKIDGKGDLYLISESNKRIKLSNVLAASDIANNLISLRHFAEAGFGIYLDDQKLLIFNKETGTEYLSGKYIQPNWVISLRVENKFENNLEEMYDLYSCDARIVSLDELLQQTQTSESLEIENVEESKSNIDDAKSSHPSEAGREIGEELTQENKDLDENTIDENNLSKVNLEIENKNFKYIDFDLDESSLKNKMINLDANDKQVEKKNNLDEIQVIEHKTRITSKGMLWHRRLGHASLTYLRMLKKSLDILRDVDFDDSIKECEVCLMTKSTKLPFNKIRQRAERALQIIHTDTMGPIRPISYPGRNRFIIVFIDDYTRFAKAYSVKSKTESGYCLEKFLQTTRNIIGSDEKVCFIRADNGTEFTGGNFLDVMNREKIDSNFGPPYTPQHNGTAERFNRTLEDIIRALMFDSGLPKGMWFLAAEVAVHIYNRTPHKSINFDTPFKKIAPNAEHNLEGFKRFGCLAYPKITKLKEKFGTTADKAIMIGYSTNGYVLWEPISKKFIYTKHVRFNEKKVFKDEYIKDKLEEDRYIEKKQVELEESTRSLGVEERNVEENTNENNIEITQETEKPKRGRSRKRKLEVEDSVTVSEPKIRRLPARKAKEGRDFTIYARNTESRKIEDTSFAYLTSKTLPLEEFKFDANFLSYNDNHVNLKGDEIRYAFLANINQDPVSFKQAMTSQDAEQWKKAVIAEINSMNENEVWTLVDKPPLNLDGRRIDIIDSKWVFKKKLDENGKTQHKARLVIRGFKDRKEYELSETYAPVSRLSIVRSVLAVVNKQDLEVCQMDVKTAFLNGTLEEDIYMQIPDGLECPDEIRRNKVCKLQKSLYGLRISPKRWNKKFSEEAIKLGLENDINEPCLFTWRHLGKVAIIVLYVDDMLIASNDIAKLEEIKTRLSKVFRMKDLGEPKQFLGMKIERDRENKIMKISQPEYTEKILEKFNMTQSKPQKTPMATRQSQKKSKPKLEETNLDLDECNTPSAKIPYREAIGSLIYLAGGTRPDIAYAVNLMSRKQLEASEQDWSDVKRIFRYLRGTSKEGIIFRGKLDNLEALTDASFRDWPDSTSTSGYVINLFGDPISWRSHKQTLVNTSTCHTEYLSMSEACQELISLDKAIRDILGKTMYPVTVWCDNQSAGNCTQMDGNQRLKSFDYELDEIKRNLEAREATGSKKPMAATHGDFVKSCVSAGKVIVRWVPTKENTADIFTKPLALEAHLYLKNKLMNLDE